MVSYGVQSKSKLEKQRESKYTGKGAGLIIYFSTLAAALYKIYLLQHL